MSKNAAKTKFDTAPTNRLPANAVFTTRHKLRRSILHYPLARYFYFSPNRWGG